VTGDNTKAYAGEDEQYNHKGNCTDEVFQHPPVFLLYGIFSNNVCVQP
jgi:hypothetical protein